MVRDSRGGGGLLLSKLLIIGHIALLGTSRGVGRGKGAGGGGGGEGYWQKNSLGLDLFP